jgi:hypothetical protein
MGFFISSVLIEDRCASFDLHKVLFFVALKIAKSCSFEKSKVTVDRKVDPELYWLTALRDNPNAADALSDVQSH